MNEKELTKIRRDFGGTEITFSKFSISGTLTSETKNVIFFEVTSFILVQILVLQ